MSGSNRHARRFRAETRRCGRTQGAWLACCSGVRHRGDRLPGGEPFVEQAEREGVADAVRPLVDRIERGRCDDERIRRERQDVWVLWPLVVVADGVAGQAGEPGRVDELGSGGRGDHARVPALILRPGDEGGQVGGGTAAAGDDVQHRASSRRCHAATRSLVAISRSSADAPLHARQSRLRAACVLSRCNGLPGGRCARLQGAFSRRRVITPHVLAAGDIDQESRATFEQDGLHLADVDLLGAPQRLTAVTKFRGGCPAQDARRSRCHELPCR